MKCAFDPESHTYRIDGRPVPSVTEVLADVIPGWQAGEWYLQRGRAVHACAALVAQGEEFDHDPRIEGQVSAVRKFLRDTGYFPELIERPVFSRMYRYGGTLDLVVRESSRLLIIDYKATLTEAVPIQMAAYIHALWETCRVKVRYGLGVQLGEDGQYKCSEIQDLRRHKSEWLALLTAFNVRRRLGVKQEFQQETEDTANG